MINGSGARDSPPAAAFRALITSGLRTPRRMRNIYIMHYAGQAKRAFCVSCAEVNVQTALSQPTWTLCGRNCERHQMVGKCWRNSFNLISPSAGGVARVAAWAS